LPLKLTVCDVVAAPESLSVTDAVAVAVLVPGVYLTPIVHDPFAPPPAARVRPVEHGLVPAVVSAKVPPAVPTFVIERVPIVRGPVPVLDTVIVPFFTVVFGLPVPVGASVGVGPEKPTTA
jgi:hypothetical protein